MAHIIAPRWPGRGLQRIPFHSYPTQATLILGALAGRAGWDAVVVDEEHEPLPSERPDAVLLTAKTTQAPRAFEIGDHYRAQGVPVVMGGVHASMLPGEALRHVDAVVGGEAEGVLGTVLDDILAGRLQRYYDGPWLDMDNVPHVSEYAHFYASMPRGRYLPTQTMQTTRGCRFNCDFCSVIRINGRGQRHMDPERVVEELRYRTTIPPWLPGPTMVKLIDDDLAADLDYTWALCEALARADLDVIWGAQSSLGIARDPALVELARRAGLTWLFIGFESVSRESLIEGNKKNRPHEYGELVETLHTHGVAIEGSFIFGFDHDEPDVFGRTVDFIDDIGVDSAQFTALTPFPGTQTYARMYDEGRIVDFDWSRYNFYQAVIEPERMTRAQLEAGVASAYADFYSRNRRWRRTAREARRRHWRTSLGVHLVNRAFEREFRIGADPDNPLAHRTGADHVVKPYRPPAEELEKLLVTSRADTNLAVRTAGAQLLSLGPRTSADEQAVTISGG